MIKKGHDNGFFVFRPSAEFSPFFASSDSVFLLRQNALVQIRDGSDAVRAICKIDGMMPEAPSLLFMPPRIDEDRPTFILANVFSI